MIRRILSTRRRTALGGSAFAADVSLLNVSYDPTRELYAEFNKAFAAAYQKETGKSVEIKQSHGGSGSQARAVIDGLQADVVTLALAYDIDAIAAKGLIATDWQKRLPQNSSPYTSTIVFLVRKGNPKGIKDWDDLIKPGVSVITPNPKTSGGARWNYLAAWGYALKKVRLRRQGKAVRRRHLQERAGARYRRARLDRDLRRARRRRRAAGLGERGVSGAEEFGKDKFEIVAPPLSILAEPPVAVVDKVADKKGTRAVAEAYLKYWYTKEGQEIAARTPIVRAIRRSRRNTRIFRQGRTFHDRRRVRRLDQGAEGTFRRRRHLRPDLQELIRCADCAER